MRHLCRALLLVPALTGGAAAAVSVIDAQGRTLAQIDTDAWCIHWNHSAAGFQVRDCYVLTGGRMVLTTSHQRDYAAGLGDIPGRGTVRADGAGGYVITDIDEAVPGNCYRLRVGSRRVDHRIVAGDVVVSLSDLAERQSVAVTAGERDNEEGRPC